MRRQYACRMQSISERYVAEIDAPTKMLVLMKGGGHSSMFMRGEFLALLHAHVRELAK